MSISMNDDDQEVFAASERHSQIMKAGDRFFRRLAIMIALGIVVACGFIIFLITSHPFWR